MQTSLINPDAIGHVTGRSVYVDDLPMLEGTVHLKVVDAPIAHGKLKAVHLDAAWAIPGVVKIITWRDIPGENQIGGILPDEPLLAEDEIHFAGQPIVIIAAETEYDAELAAKAVRFEIEPHPVVTDPREAFRCGLLLSGSRVFQNGDTETAFAQCAHVIEGTAESGGQEHLYLETQGAYAYPTESGGVRVHASTQGPTAVQKSVARILGLSMSAVEVDVVRLGGGFGGKEDQASTWGAFAALAAHVLHRPAKILPHRMEDMRMTGKRHPYSSDFRIGLDADLNILAYEATYYQNGGAAADLSPAILERTLFHATNTYAIPNVKAVAHSCKTNLPPNTAFRGFGGPQGMFVIEAAVDAAARALGIPAHVIQAKNLVQNGYEMSYGQVLRDVKAEICWQQAITDFKFDARLAEAETFNTTHPFEKKGLAVMPICFGISFTNTMLNQARALVHVYTDGSVSVSTGAVEMGQGVNTKMRQVAAHTLGIPQDRIRLLSTNTDRVANTSPTAASATADLNGKAVLDACHQIRDRLTAFAQTHYGTENVDFVNGHLMLDGQLGDVVWEDVISAAYVHRINLSAKGHYATPEIHFDKSTEKGHPFAYHVYGTALFTVTVDCIRGTYTLDAVEVIHDAGASINPLIDLGQCEGGIMQGIGWMTMEDLVFDAEGRLRSNALSTYKIPDIYFTPRVFEVRFLADAGHDLAILKSKAVGEPPLMYGIGAYFAIRNAILAFNPSAHMPYSAPITPEKVLMALHNQV